MNKLLKTTLLSLSLVMPAAHAEISAEQAKQLVNNTGIVASQNDISRGQLATALLNRMAEIALKEYQLQEEKMYMAAPGSPEAIAAGKLVGGLADHTQEETVNFANNALGRGLGSGGGASTYSPGGALANSVDDDLFTQGNASQLGGLNAANILQADSVEAEDSQRLIDVITYPLPNPRLPSGADDAAKADVLSELAQMSVAANALGEIAAKRMEDNNGRTVAQLLRDESTRRFADEQWFGNIAISSQEALLRELAQMEAFKLKLQYEQYRLQEQNTALMAAMLSSMAKMSKVINMLNAQLRQSTQQLQQAADDIDTEALEDQMQNFDPRDYQPPE